MTNSEWVDKCQHWKKQWPIYQSEHADDSRGLDIYEVLESINEILTDNNLVVADAGSPSYACPTALKATCSNQFIFNPSQADMGWAVPASVGVALNAKDKLTLAIIGDGSFYSNMQEIAVIKYLDLPIKLIVLNNGGYLSIKNTQTKYFEGRVYGVDQTSGLFFPQLDKVAEAFEIKYQKISNRNELKSAFGVLNDRNNRSAELIEVMCKIDQEILPAQSFKVLPDGKRVQAPLHDMAPFLSQEELDREWPIK